MSLPLVRYHLSSSSPAGVKLAYSEAKRTVIEMGHFDRVKDVEPLVKALARGDKSEALQILDSIQGARNGPPKTTVVEAAPDETGASPIDGLNARDAVRAIRAIESEASVLAALDAERASAAPRKTVIEAAERQLNTLQTQESDE